MTSWKPETSVGPAATSPLPWPGGPAVARRWTAPRQALPRSLAPEDSRGHILQALRRSPGTGTGTRQQVNGGENWLVISYMYLQDDSP